MSRGKGGFDNPPRRREKRTGRKRGYLPGATSDQPPRELTTAEKFFYDHAGYSYDPAWETKETGRLRSAKAHAKAEAWASANGYTFEWEHEQEDWESFFEDQRDIEAIRDGSVEVYFLVMRDPEGHMVQSLGGIGLTKGPEGRRHARVFEAELALEEMGDR